jgi:hypothetical protein
MRQNKDIESIFKRWASVAENRDIPPALDRHFHHLER